MGTISSKSPRMAYSNGELWVSAHDEAGRRCWVNNATGERTYSFFEGNPVSASANSQLIPITSNGTVYFNAHGTQNPVHAFNAAPSAAPLTQPGVAAPAIGRGIQIGGKEGYYMRSTYKKGSWMWK